MTQQLVTQAELAAQLQINRSTVSRHCRPGGVLSDAMLGDKIDLGHPEVRRYVDSKRQDGSAEPPKPIELEGFDDDGSPDKMVAIQDLTLREVGERFGSIEGFSDWLKMLKLAEDVRATRLRNDAASGDRIPWEVVETQFFGGMEGLSRRLLADIPKTTARQLYANQRAGVPIETSAGDLTKLLEREISTTARRVRSALEKSRNTKPEEEKTEHAEQD